VSSQSIGAGTERAQFLGGNSRRVGLIVSGDATTVVRVGFRGGSDSGGVFVYVDSTRGRELPFRDYGPTIQGEIWCSHISGFAIVIAVTEIYLITRC